MVGLWGVPPQRSPGSSPTGNCRNGGAILARAKTAPLPVPPSKRMKSPSNIMRQSSLTKLGSMINTAVNKRAVSTLNAWVRVVQRDTTNFKLKLVFPFAPVHVAKRLRFRFETTSLSPGASPRVATN